MKLVASLSLILSLASSVQANRNTLRCLDPDDVDYTKDYFPDKAVPEFSKLWNITYHNTYKILTNYDTDTSYALYQCGTELPEGVREQHTDAWSVPLQDGIAASATSQIPQLEQLGVRRQLKGYLGNPAGISSPCMKTLAAEGIIQGVNDPSLGSWQQTADGTPLADFIVENPEIVILKSSGTGDKTLNFVAYKEAGNKATYEWHKVVGALFNLEKIANEQFEESSTRYDCVSDNADYLLAEQAESRARTRNLADVATKPKVLWAYYYGGCDTFYYEGCVTAYWDVARCDARNEYYCEFAEACSAELLHSNNGTIPVGDYEPDGFHMTTEDFLKFGKDADHWILPSYVSDFETEYAQFWDEISQWKSVANKEVYDIQKSGGGSWFEQRIAEYGACHIMSMSVRMYVSSMLDLPCIY